MKGEERRLGGAALSTVWAPLLQPWLRRRGGGFACGCRLALVWRAPRQLRFPARQGNQPARQARYLLSAGP